MSSYDIIRVLCIISTSLVDFSSKSPSDLNMCYKTFYIIRYVISQVTGFDHPPKSNAFPGLFRTSAPSSALLLAPG